MDAISPRCTEFIFECQFENMVLTPDQCCTSVFDPEPIYSEYGRNERSSIYILRTYLHITMVSKFHILPVGVCYSTRNKAQGLMVTRAGSGTAT